MHRTFRTNFVFLAALTGSTLLARSPMSFAENPQVTVSVYDDAHVPREILARAEGRAAKIFGQVGVKVNWLDCNLTNSIHCATAFEIDSAVQLNLRITPNIANSTSDTAFGVAYLATDGTGRYADVFWKRAQDLQANSKVDPALILASVMAHEVGHMLLGSNAHAVSGIMEAHWGPGELRRIGMGSLLFLPDQGKQMRARVTQRTEAKSVSSRAASVRATEDCQRPQCAEHQ